MEWTSVDLKALTCRCSAPILTQIALSRLPAAVPRRGLDVRTWLVVGVLGVLGHESVDFFFLDWKDLLLAQKLDDRAELGFALDGAPVKTAGSQPQPTSS